MAQNAFLSESEIIDLTSLFAKGLKEFIPHGYSQSDILQNCALKLIGEETKRITKDLSLSPQDFTDKFRALSSLAEKICSND